MERLSRFWVIAARSVVSIHEIEALLDKMAGPRPVPIVEMNYLDWGVMRAMGRVGGVRVEDEEGEDVTSRVRSSHPDGPEAFDAAVAGAELDLNRRVLDGPTPDEEPELRLLGWNPEPSIETAKKRAEQEIEQARRFNEHPKWRRGRIRDAISAREVIIENMPALGEALSNRDAILEVVFPTPEVTRRAWDSMPSFDVAVTLKASYHRNPQHIWTPNDIHDIDALGSSLPYCDVVATDKAAATQATRTGLAERLGTTVLHRLSDLPDHL